MIVSHHLLKTLDLEDDMGVLPPTTYEQRASLYEDLITLLTNGFLTHRCNLGGSIIAIRNLNTADSFFLKHSVVENDDGQWMLWTVSRAVWMIDGFIFLGEKNYAYYVYQQIKHLPRKMITRLFRLVVSLTKAVSEQHSLIEAFYYEEHSRSLWTQIKHLSLPNDKVSGITGSETIGINHIQRLWVSLNTYRDKVIEERKEWANAKFIASASAPKGVDKINKKEQSAMQQEENTRKRFLDEFYYRQTGVITDEKDDPTSKRVVKSASTPDELEDEMRRWVSGEYDDHDRIVSAYKNKIKQKHEIELRDRQQRLADVQRELEEEGEDIISLSPLIGYTKDQLKELLVEKGHNEDGKKVARVMYQDQSTNLYNKHIGQRAGTGKLKVKDGKIVVKGQDNSLMEDVAKRSVKGGVEDNE